MRNTNARILLGACLLVATATAQAQAIPQSYGGGGSYDKPTYNDAYGLSSAPSALPQGNVDYTMRALFLSQHGDFMNRRQRYTPDVELAARVLPNQRVNNEPGSFDMLGYDLDATFRPLVSTDGYLTFGAYYKARRYLASSDFGDGGGTEIAVVFALGNPESGQDAGLLGGVVGPQGVQFGDGLVRET